MCIRAYRRLLVPRRLLFICLVLVLISFSIYKSQLPASSLVPDDTVYFFDYKRSFTARDEVMVPPSASNRTSRRSTQVASVSSSQVGPFVNRTSQNLFFNNCGDTMCTNLLSETDMLSLKKCPLRRSKRKHRSYRQGKCRFMNSIVSDRGPVALVSAPGSGNTWVRGLLEKVTGVCTGSVYCDQALKRAGFSGEGLYGNGVIVVKTHEAPPDSWMNRSTPLQDESALYFKAAILIVRDPFDALVSEWTREKSGGHVAAARVKVFGQYPKWVDYVQGRGLGFWKISLNLWYLSNDHHPLLVVRYEDLKRNLTGEVKRMLDFLQFPYTDESLDSALADGYTLFKRTHKPSEEVFQHFTDEQKALVNNTIQEIIDGMVMQKYDTLRLSEYFRS